MKALRYHMLVILMLITTLISPAVMAAQGEDQLKAAFIHRFMQFTQWPPPPLSDFNYCVVGSQALQEAMEEIARRSVSSTDSGISIHGKLFVIKDPQQALKCQLLVLNISDRGELLRWQKILADAPVLIIGDNAEAFRSGVAIALVTEPNGMSFRINHTEAKRRGLVLSSQMLKLAREVK